jgi:hypothetical protein
MAGSSFDKQHVNVTFPTDGATSKGAECVFYIPNDKSVVVPAYHDLLGSWSSKGCEVASTDDLSVTCSCTHLTHFAVIMQTDAGFSGWSEAGDGNFSNTFLKWNAKKACTEHL